MSKTILITVSTAAHKRLGDVQDKLTKSRKAKNAGASKANQADAMEWILTHTLMPISDFQDDSEEVA